MSHQLFKKKLKKKRQKNKQKKNPEDDSKSLVPQIYFHARATNLIIILIIFKFI